MRRTLPWLALLGLAACDTSSQPLAAVAPTFQLDQTTEVSGIIPGRYIVTVKDEVDPALVAGDHGIEPDFVYRSALNGFAGAFSDVTREALRLDGRVTLVESDMVAYATTTQSSAPWGLDRIDQRALPLSMTYSYNHTGKGVIAYVVDTGIRVTHQDFQGRASAPYHNNGAGFDAMTDGQKGNDCNGHGSHVAGTVGGRTYGVAKEVKLVAVRVLGCDGSGTAAGIVAGMDYIWAQKNAAPSQPMLANLSLGFPLRNTSADNAVQKVINKGVPVFVAAGNGVANRGVPQDACMISPAAVPDAVTIGNANRFDEKSTSSNYGDCVDFFAPGASILSAWYTSDTASNTISGTSMAAPHAAGVGALYLQQFPGASPKAVRDALFAATTKGVVQLSLTANNHLLYSFVGALNRYNRAPVANAGGPYTALEGSAVTLNGGGSSDPDGDALTYSWSFEDGSTATGAQTSRAFADNGTYTVTLTVTDANGAQSTATSQVTVSNVAPAVSAGSNATRNEGSLFSQAGSFTDPGADTWTASVDYGDGSGPRALTLSGKSFDLGHTYADDGVYTVTVSVTDKDGGVGVEQVTVTVINLVPVADAGPGATVVSGRTFGFRGTFSDAGINDSPWSYSIDWGNGSASTTGTTSNQAQALTASGRYFRAGSYTVRFGVTDKDGGSGAATTTVNVVRAPVQIDVRPGSTDNSISWNESNSAKLPVAVLGTAELSARDVVVSSVRIGDVRVASRKNGTSMFSYSDVNADGREDLVLHFELQALIDSGALTRDTTLLELVADLASGVQVRGTDTVRVQ